MLVASWRRALRISMCGLRFGATRNVASDESLDAGLRVGQRGADARARGAAENVVAVERGLERDGGKEVLFEFFAVLAQLIEGEVAELALLFDTVADGVANLLVRLAEGNALVDEIRGRGHGVEESSLRGGQHTVVAEVQRAGEGRQQGEDSGERVGDF